MVNETEYSSYVGRTTKKDIDIVVMNAEDRDQARVRCTSRKAYAKPRRHVTPVQILLSMVSEAQVVISSPRAA